jgi:hypothetical protein
MKREIEIGRFLAKSESGEEYIIIEYQEYVSAATMGNPHAEVAGLRSYFTSTGLHVNYIDSETFKVVETDEVVRKV